MMRRVVSIHRDRVMRPRLIAVIDHAKGESGSQRHREEQRPLHPGRRRHLAPPLRLSNNSAPIAGGLSRTIALPTSSAGASICTHSRLKLVELSAGSITNANNAATRREVTTQPVRELANRHSNVAPHEDGKCRVVAARGGREQRRIRPLIIVHAPPRGVPRLSRLASSLRLL